MKPTIAVAVVVAFAAPAHAHIGPDAGIHHVLPMLPMLLTIAGMYWRKFFPHA